MTTAVFTITQVVYDFTATSSTPVVTVNSTDTTVVVTETTAIVTATNNTVTVDIIPDGIVSTFQPSTGFTQTFSGNANQRVFTLSLAPVDGTFVEVAIGGVIQNPANYSVVGTTLTFVTAPPAGTNNILVRFYTLLSSVVAIGPQGPTGAQGPSGPSGAAGGTIIAASAYASTTTTLYLSNTETVYTKLIIDTKEFDTNNIYSTSTYRLTPITGYYQINASYSLIPPSSVPVKYGISLYKNNSLIKTILSYNSIGRNSPMLSEVIYANGTDYFEFYAVTFPNGLAPSEQPVPTAIGSILGPRFSIIN